MSDKSYCAFAVATFTTAAGGLDAAAAFVASLAGSSLSLWCAPRVNCVCPAPEVPEGVLRILRDQLARCGPERLAQSVVVERCGALVILGSFVAGAACSAVLFALIFFLGRLRRPTSQQDRAVETDSQQLASDPLRGGSLPEVGLRKRGAHTPSSLKALRDGGAGH